MNKKNIKAVLARKHKEFIASIKNNAVRNLVRNNSIVSGGAIASMLAGEKVNDFDYYLTDLDTVKAVAKYYVGEFGRLHSKMPLPEVRIDAERVRIRIKSAGVIGDAREAFADADEFDAEQLEGESTTDTEKEKYRPLFMSDNAITLANKVQLVIRFHGDADKIHENFDYVHCTNYWEAKTGKLTLRQAALESLLSKQLNYVGSKYPLCSIVRMRKFINRGWHINAGQILKMLMQVSDLDLTDIAVLEDQLTGVDTTFFAILIDTLKAKAKADPDFTVNRDYVATIVDRIFG